MVALMSVEVCSSILLTILDFREQAGLIYGLPFNRVHSYVVSLKRAAQRHGWARY